MAVITGTNGNNTRNGTSAADLMFGLAGDDTLHGLGGGDKLRGDSGADNLFGDAGTDWALYDTDPSRDGVGGGVFVQLSSGTALDGYGFTDKLTSIENVIGSQFDDIIDGDGKANRLEGRSGSDFLAGFGGNDKLYGGDGDDFGNGTPGDPNDQPTAFGLDGGAGNDELHGGAGNDSLFGDSGLDKLFGEDGNDLLLGGDDKDVLRGGSGEDDLQGGSGNDDLGGDAGDDLLNGGFGDDILRGGGLANVGRDTFIYDARGDGNLQGDDIIVDFRRGFDTVLFHADGLTSFDDLNSNGDLVLDSKDFAVTVRNITFEGATHLSTVIDVSKLEFSLTGVGDGTTVETLTFFDRPNILASDFTIIGPDPVTVVDGTPIATDPLPEPDPNNIPPPSDLLATSI